MLKEVPNFTELKDDGVSLFLFVDFDGVFNSFYRRGTFKKEFFPADKREMHPNFLYDKDVVSHMNYLGREYREPKAFELQWSSDFVSEFNKLSALNHVQVVWLTTWRENMADVVLRLGLTSNREMFYLPWGSDFNTTQDYKVVALRKYLGGVGENSCKIVWIDDIAIPKYLNDPETFTMKFPDFTQERFLRVTPNENFGVSRAEWNSVLDFSKNSN